MRRAEAEKLLGGYATGTLTETERQALLEAALADQELFDALADEEALRELLSDAQSRRRLLDAVSEPEVSLLERVLGWWRRPVAWGVAGSVAVAVMLVVMLVPVYRPVAKKPAVQDVAPGPVETAQKIEPAAPAPAAPRARRLAAPPARKSAAAPALAEQRQPVEAEVSKKELAAAPAPAAPAPRELPRGGAVGGVVGGVAQSAAVHVYAESVLTDARARYYGPVAERKDLARTALRAERAAVEEAAPRAAPALGLRYALMKLGADGQYSEVDPDSAFSPGDSIRLSVEANLDGTLQLLAQDPAGAWHEVQQVTLVPRSRQILPTKGALAVRGTERLRLVFSAAGIEGLKLKGQQAVSPAVMKASDEKAVYAIRQGPGLVSVDIELRRQ